MRKNYWWLLVVIIFVVSFMISNSFVYAQRENTETQWEYKIVYAKDKGSMKKQVKQDLPILNELGRKGWELVTVQYSNYYFKRKIRKK